MEKGFSKKVIALALAMFFAGGVAGFLVGYPVGRGATGVGLTEEGGMLIHDVQDEGISMTSVAIPVSEYGDYDIMPIAESAKQVTATVKPAEAEDAVLDWSLAWKSGASGQWGYGKRVTDYVTVTPISDGAKTANVQCLKPFGEQIVITAAIRGNASVKGTVTAGYKQKIDHVTYSVTGGAGQDTSITIPASAHNSTVEYTYRTLDFGSTGKGTGGIEWSFTDYTEQDPYINDSRYDPTWNPTHNWKFTIEGNPNYFSDFKIFVNSGGYEDYFTHVSGLRSAIDGIPDNGKCISQEGVTVFDFSCVGNVLGSFFDSFRSLVMNVGAYDVSRIFAAYQKSYMWAGKPIAYLNFENSSPYSEFKAKVAIFWDTAALGA